jgi:hypothetical protein
VVTPGLVVAAGLVVIAVIAGIPGAAHAQPGAAASGVLREANTAALAGDWDRVARLVDPLLARPADPSQPASLPTPDLAEAHRLAGLAAFFHQRGDAAERHFVSYLQIDLDGRLDPALYPPDVVAFFNDVASRHTAELRALRIVPKRSWWLTLLPPFGQLQNGERTKAYLVGGTLGALLVVNLTTYYYLRAWCNHTDGSAGGALTCDEDGGDHTAAARRIRPFNLGSGIGFLLTYTYGVYDGVRGYRRHSNARAMQPFVDASRGGTVAGVAGRF